MGAIRPISGVQDFVAANSLLAQVNAQNAARAQAERDRERAERNAKVGNILALGGAVAGGIAGGAGGPLGVATGASAGAGLGALVGQAITPGGQVNASQAFQGAQVFGAMAERQQERDLMDANRKQMLGAVTGQGETPAGAAQPPVAPPVGAVTGALAAPQVSPPPAAPPAPPLAAAAQPSAPLPAPAPQPGTAAAVMAPSTQAPQPAGIPEGLNPAQAAMVRYSVGQLPKSMQERYAALPESTKTVVGAAMITPQDFAVEQGQLEARLRLPIYDRETLGKVQKQVVEFQEKQRVAQVWNRTVAETAATGLDARIQTVALASGIAQKDPVKAMEWLAKHDAYGMEKAIPEIRKDAKGYYDAAGQAYTHAKEVLSLDRTGRHDGAIQLAVLRMFQTGVATDRDVAMIGKAAGVGDTIGAWKAWLTNEGQMTEKQRNAVLNLAATVYKEKHDLYQGQYSEAKRLAAEYTPTPEKYLYFQPLPSGEELREKYNVRPLGATPGAQGLPPAISAYADRLKPGNPPPTPSQIKALESHRKYLSPEQQWALDKYKARYAEGGR